MEVRLQKFLADAGIASRRKAEELILAGKVSVNGKIVSELGTKVNTKKDKILFEGKLAKTENRKRYILLNKPAGYISAAKDQFDNPSVLHLLNNVRERVFPIGRLDKDTTGALLLTNDGELAYKITHPKHEIDKTYTVTVKGIVTNEEVEQLKNGVEIEDYITKPAKVRILKTDTEKDISRLEITIHEGKNRQVRKMCEAGGRKVQALHRSKIGNIDVKDLKLGNWRYLKQSEINELLR